MMKLLECLIKNQEMLAARWDRNPNCPDYMTGWDVLQDMAEKFLINPDELETEEDCL